MPRIASARIPAALAACALSVAACVDDPAPSPDTASAALVDDTARTTATLRRQLAELTQGGVLTTHALPTTSSPIHRGKLVRERLLCQELPPPPPSLDTSPPPVDPALLPSLSPVEPAPLVAAVEPALALAVPVVAALPPPSSSPQARGEAASASASAGAR